jgi:small subunit ribosomal protein S9
LETPISATGRRKTAIARVILKPGKGEAKINGGLSLKEYLRSDSLVTIVETPFKVLDIKGSWDIVAQVHGGGIAGQAGALLLGVSRALAKMSDEYHKKMRDNGLLTRDSREVERKKYGRSGARKRFQFSKR